MHRYLRQSTLPLTFWSKRNRNLITTLKTEKKTTKKPTYPVRKSSRALKHRSLPCFWPGSGMWHLLTSKNFGASKADRISLQYYVHHLRQSQVHKKHFSSYCCFVFISPILKYPIVGSWRVNRSLRVGFRIKTNGAALTQWLLLSKSCAKLLWLQTAIFLWVFSLPLPVCSSTAGHVLEWIQIL